MLRVRNMINKASGREVANQFIIEDDTKVMFQSYSSPIVEIDWENSVINVYEDWNYSVTTSKYRNAFMEDNGFYDMNNKKGFEKHLELGVVKNCFNKEFKVIKCYE